MSWTTKSEQWSIGGVSIKPVAAAVGLASGNNYYQCTTNATAGGDLSLITGNWVVFVDGNLTVSSNVIINGSSTLTFVVRGNITVNTSVTQADGIYIAGGVDAAGADIAGSAFADTGGTAPGTITQLVVNGGVYAASFNLARVLSANNDSIPADLFNFQPKYLLNLSSLLGSPQLNWREVAL
jgi:hypothetical protein